MSHVKILPKGRKNLMLISYHERSPAEPALGGQRRQVYGV